MASPPAISAWLRPAPRIARDCRCPRGCRFDWRVASITINQRAAAIPAEKRALHYRLLGVEPGQVPLDGRHAAREVLSNFLPEAFRHPVDAATVDKYLTLYDRAAQRGDPWT